MSAKPAPSHDVRVAIITAIGTIAAAIITNGALLAVGWLEFKGSQDKGPQTSPNSSSSASGQATVNTISAQQSIKFSKPAKEEKIPRRLERISGTVSGLKPGQVVWLFDKLETAKDYYPGDYPCVTKDNGDWVCPPLEIGDKEDDRRYELIAVIADAEAQRAIIEWHYNQKTGENYEFGMPGLPRGSVLPEGSDGRIFVQRL